jgi:hypothetical protein
MTFWLPLMEAGFVFFLVALYALVWRGGTRDGGFGRGAWKWILLAAAAFAVWALALGRIPRP